MKTKDELGDEIVALQKNKNKIIKEQGHYSYANQVIKLTNDILKRKDLTKKEKRGLKTMKKLTEMSLSIMEMGVKLQNKINKKKLNKIPNNKS